MKLFFIVWSDYDGSYVDSYSDEEQCLRNVATIQNLYEKEQNGTKEPLVYYGERKEFETVSVTTEVKFK